MALPTACNVKTPLASQCNGTSNSPSSGGGGSKSNVRTTDDSTSAGNSTKLSFSVLSFSAQATTAYSKGELEYAAYLSDQVCFLLGGCYELLRTSTLLCYSIHVCYFYRYSS
ncbi:hypothetical protein J1N35_008536 [Gossypium stocksii]|uniref:Uncharacterized protein n=1 Tax=Gossypium stocksii TaxID=47602 RepID=A0A9D3WAI2_9ROSI|nr:hypothetical protein J1N35_008536 [Gossypium stocksii]